LRTTGRTCTSSLLRSFSQAEVIFLSTGTQPMTSPRSNAAQGRDPHWKIPVAQWPTVLHRIDQGEPLRKVAGEYGVSYEAVRRVLRTARQTRG
ncbi:MAG TPA: hypothetical protein VF043_14265, partial [Ktedonobacteraceae bacterium]